MSSFGDIGGGAGTFLRRTCRSKGTLSLLAAIIGIQWVVEFSGGPNQWPARHWFEELGLNRQGIASGRIWQLMTYGLLHGGWWHAALNSIWLLMIGSRVEEIAGRREMFKAVALGISGGGVFHVLLAPGGIDAPILVGLSGGCVALLLVLTTLSPESRMMPVPVSARSLGYGILTGALLLALIDPRLNLPILGGFGSALERMGLPKTFEMGHACHLGGGLAGWACGRWLLRSRVTLKQLRLARDRYEAKRIRKSG